jgi:membrane associated rhomboid family serine protease
MDSPAAIACLLVIGVTCGASYLGFTRPAFFEKWLFSPEAVLRDRQIARLVTSGFLHGDWGHLILNMVSLYSFGSAIELQFGARTFLAVYFSAIVGGSLVSLALHRHEEYRAVGASGGVCGILFAAIFLLQGSAVQVFFIPINIPCWLYAILFLVLSFFGLRSGRGRIGHDAHLGGAIIGLLVATALFPEIVRQRPILFAVVMGLALAMAAYLYKYPLDRGRPDVFSRTYWRDLESGLRRGLRRRRRMKDEQMLDRLLEKIARQGTGSLTRWESRRLETISRRKARDRPR